MSPWNDVYRKGPGGRGRAFSAASMAPKGRHAPGGTANAPLLSTAMRASSPHAAALAPHVATVASASSTRPTYGRLSKLGFDRDDNAPHMARPASSTKPTCPARRCPS